MKGAESTRLRRGTRADITKLSRLISVIASLRCDTHRARCLPAGLDVLCHPERSEGSSGCFFFNNGRLPRPLCMVPVFAHSLERGLAMTNLSLRSLPLFTPHASSRKDESCVIASLRCDTPRARCLPAGLDVLCHPERSEGSSGWFPKRNKGRLPQLLEGSLALTNRLLRLLEGSLAMTDKASSRACEAIPKGKYFSPVCWL